MASKRRFPECGDGYTILDVQAPTTMIPIVGWHQNFDRAAVIARQWPGAVVVQTSGPDYVLTGASCALRHVTYLVTRYCGSHVYESRPELVG